MKKILIEWLLRIITGALSGFIKRTVASLKDSPLEGKEKREEAIRVIKEESKKLGEDLADSVINLGVELGVALIKEKM